MYFFFIFSKFYIFKAFVSLMAVNFIASQFSTTTFNSRGINVRPTTKRKIIKQPKKYNKNTTISIIVGISESFFFCYNIIKQNSKEKKYMP